MNDALELLDMAKQSRHEVDNFMKDEHNLANGEDGLETLSMAQLDLVQVLSSAWLVVVNNQEQWNMVRRHEKITVKVLPTTIP